MKLNSNNEEVLSNNQSEKSSFSISNNTQDTALAIDVITNKGYKHKIQTPVQEYLCNARDAHREAGQSRPLEVTIPTPFDPVFKVRDFGLGITPEKMTDVFIKFFASTKRKDNVQTGGFGLGAKSAWAYTDSFGIVSITDGVKRSYTAYKSGQGILQPESESPTTEPSGVEISIAVNPQDFKKFKSAVIRTILFWNEKERPVLNDKTPISFPTPVFTHKNMSFYKPEDIEILVKRDEYGYGYHTGYDSVILDGIVYTIENDELFSKNRYSEERIHPFFLNIEVGNVSITPFRESLEYDEKTNAFLKNMIAEQSAEVCSIVKEKIKQSKTIQDKIKTISSFKYVANLNKVSLNRFLTYQNQSINLFLRDEEMENLSIISLDCRHYDTFRTHKNWFQALIDDKTIFIEYNSKESMKKVKEKIKALYHKQKKEISNILIFSFKEGSENTEEILKSGFTFINSLTLEPVTPETHAKKDPKIKLLLNDSILNLKHEKLKNHFYILSSEFSTNKTLFQDLAAMMNCNGQTLVLVPESLEEEANSKGIKPFLKNLKSVKIPWEIALFYSSSFYRQMHLKNLSTTFKNKKILNYIKVVQKCENPFRRNKQRINLRNPDDVYNFLKTVSPYKENIEIFEEGKKILNQHFSLLNHIDFYGLKTKEINEVKLYIKMKEKELKNG